MSNPTVDILMATYNGEQYIADQIKSIQSQSYQDWRLLVSDDCSIDNTVGVIKKFAERDSRIHVISEGVRHGGAKENFMSLVTRSTAAYALFSDQDDVWKPFKIEHLVGCANYIGDKQPLLVFSDMQTVNEDLSVIAESFMDYSGLDPYKTTLNSLLALNCVPGCTTLMNRELVKCLNSVPAPKEMTMHDAWCALVAASIGRIYYTDERTISYRQHGDNDIGAKGYIKAIKAGMFDSTRHETLIGTVHQAQALLRAFGSRMPEEKRRVVEVYSALNRMTKIERIACLTKYGFWKYGTARKIDQLLNL